MMSRRNVEVVRRTIAFYEILGAAWSARAMYEVIAHARGLLVPWSVLFFMVCAYALVAIAGLFLLRGTALGEVLSYAAQALQVIHIIAGPAALSFVAGFEASIYFMGDHFTSFVGLSATFNYLRNPSDPPFAIGVNFVPLALLAILIVLPPGRSDGDGTLSKREV